MEAQAENTNGIGNPSASFIPQPLLRPVYSSKGKVLIDHRLLSRETFLAAGVILREAILRSLPLALWSGTEGTFLTFPLVTLQTRFRLGKARCIDRLPRKVSASCAVVASPEP